MSLAESGLPPETLVWNSSVPIPLILPRSKSFLLYSRIEQARWSVAVTPAILQEVRDKLKGKPSLRRWLDLTDDDISMFVDNVLPGLVTIYPGMVKVTGAVAADPDDDIVIAAAVESQAKFILTEDRHLLDLGKYAAIRIINRDTLQLELDQLGVP